MFVYGCYSTDPARGNQKQVMVNGIDRAVEHLRLDQTGREALDVMCQGRLLMMRGTVLSLMGRIVWPVENL